MSVNLITGYAGEAHVTSQDDGAVNAGVIGNGKYVFKVGEKFAYEIISNNLIRIKDGYMINQGRKIGIKINDYEDVTIDNGLQSVKRSDLIVMRYTKNADTGIEIAEIVVIKGVSGDTAVNPSYIYGDILNGDLVDDFPLYRVKLNGLNIEGVDKLFTTNKTLDEVNTKLTAESNKVGLLANLMTTIKTSIVDAINSLVIKLGTTDISTIGDGTVTGGISALDSANNTVNSVTSTVGTVIGGYVVAGKVVTLSIKITLTSDVTLNSTNIINGLPTPREFIDCPISTYYANSGTSFLGYVKTSSKSIRSGSSFPTGTILSFSGSYIKA